MIDRKTCAVFVLALLCMAHVGSPDTFFEGSAGPYPVRVIIRAPQVIPARAEVIVRVNERGIQRITAAPYIWNGGDKGAPPPDELTRVPGDSTLWSTQLWIMAQGSYSVRVRVEGARGAGTAVVPFTAVATAVLAMDRGMAILLAGLGLFLAVGFITLIGAGAREGTLEPGLSPERHRVRASWMVRLGATVFVVLLLIGGRAWWGSEHRAYAEGVFRNATASVTLTGDSAHPILHLAIDQSVTTSRRWTPFIPDHGKLMHLFLIRDDLGAIAHLHPVASDSLTYSTPLPPLPAGSYHVYADVVHENGFAETIVATTRLGGGEGTKGTDPDDAVFVGGPGDTSVSFPDGTRLVWLRGAADILPRTDAPLHFVLRGPRGDTTDVQPYLGMSAHAVVVKRDQSVFVHLHPMGSASLAAQQALTAFTPADTARGAIRAKLAAQSSAMSMGALPGVFDFPYAFPKNGAYRIWVEFRRGGTVRTAAYDVRVN